MKPDGFDKSRFANWDTIHISLIISILASVPRQDRRRNDRENKTGSRAYLLLRAGIVPIGKKSCRRSRQKNCPALTIGYGRKSDYFQTYLTYDISIS